MPRKIGVFGGSFNPIHNGHLILAEQVREMAGLDKVIFVPNYFNPFKIGREQPSGIDRYNMIKAAIEDAPNMEVSDFEISREEPSYTYDTLMHFKEVYGDSAELCFILGTDTIKNLKYWKNGAKLIENFEFISIYRKGEDRTPVDEAVKDLKENFPTSRVSVFESPELEISSSDIRERLRFGQSIRFLTPDSVIDYIEKTGLYSSLTRELGNFVKSNVKPSRYSHIIHVVKKAQELGQKYGADVSKLEIAAIFHDAYRDAGNLEHGPLAAEHLEKDFGVTDPVILNAVRYHTTGRAGMAPEEMILKMADMLEDSRSYDEVTALRASLTDDLESSFLHIMNRVKVYVEGRGFVLDSNSAECIKWLNEKLHKEN